MRKLPTSILLTSLSSLTSLVLLPTLAGAAEPIPLRDWKAASELCETMRTENSVRFSGDEVERGRARAAYQERRGRALSEFYRTTVVSSGFSFGEYDVASGQLPLDLGRSMRVSDGLELSLGPDLDDDFSFTVSEAEASDIVRAREQGRLMLGVTFRLAAPGELPDPCVRLGGGRSLKVRVEPLTFVLRDLGGKILGKAASTHGIDAEEVTANTAHVRAETGEGKPAPGASELEEALLKCYRSGLEKNSRLRGTMTLALTLGGGGAVSQIRTELDSIADSDVTSCTLGRVKAHKFGGGSRNLSLTLHFGGSQAGKGNHETGVVPAGPRGDGKKKSPGINDKGQSKTKAKTKVP